MIYLKFSRTLAWGVLVAALGLVGGRTLNAQDEESKTPSVIVWFLFLDESEGAFYLKSATGYELLSGSPYSVEGRKTFKPGERIEIYKTLNRKVLTDDARVASASGRRVKVAEFPAPLDTASALAVLAPGPNEGGIPSYRVRFFEESPEEQVGGTIKLINLGQTRSAVALGAEYVVLQPGQIETIQAPVDSRNRLKVQVADELGGDWNVIERRVVFLRPNESMTGIFVYSPTGMKHLYSSGELLSLGGDPPPGHAWLQFKH